MGIQRADVAQRRLDTSACPRVCWIATRSKPALYSRQAEVQGRSCGLMPLSSPFVVCGRIPHSLCLRCSVQAGQVDQGLDKRAGERPSSLSEKPGLYSSRRNQRLPSVLFNTVCSHQSINPVSERFLRQAASVAVWLVKRPVFVSGALGCVLHCRDYGEVIVFPRIRQLEIDDPPRVLGKVCPFPLH